LSLVLGVYRRRSGGARWTARRAPFLTVPDVDSNCRLLIVPPFRGSSRFESLILSHHSRTKLHVSVMNEVKAEA